MSSSTVTVGEYLSILLVLFAVTPVCIVIVRHYRFRLRDCTWCGHAAQRTSAAWLAPLDEGACATAAELQETRRTCSALRDSTRCCDERCSH